MMKRILFLLLTVMFSATGAVLNATAQNKKLCFRADGKFKIVQFTDDHVVWQDHRSDTAFACIKHIIKIEKPDFIILTGDIIFSNPGIDNFKQVINYVASFKIPFAFVFGNHDQQFGATDSMLLNAVKDVPYNLTTTVAGVSGYSNFDLPVYSSNKQKIEALIYGFDSHSFNGKYKQTGVSGYDYIFRDQIDWYVRTSRQYTAENGGQALPAVAFFHIPLPEYAYALTDPHVRYYGLQNEAICSSPLNSGLFTAMKEQGDVMGVFCGHDHVNDYAANYNGILLAYGRYSGGNTVYNDNKCNGARIIELSEGHRTIHSWIRLSDGSSRQNTFFPQDYIIKP